MHFRGCSGNLNRLNRSHHSDDIGNIAFIVKSLRQRYPQAPLAVVGYSLDGNALLKYMGESGIEPSVAAAVAISLPYALQDSLICLSLGLSRLRRRRLLHLLNKKLSLNLSLAIFILTLLNYSLSILCINLMIGLPHCRTDSTIEDDYYKQSSSRRYLASIRASTLLIHARNNPFMTSKSIPGKNELPESVILELSDNGEHVGFIGGSIPWKPEFWLERRVHEFLINYF